MSAPTLTAPKSITGSFTAEAFAAHLAAQKSAPAWWLEHKRAAYEKFAALPMPKRTDESWRFSNIGTLTLDGFERGEDYSFLGDDVVVHKSEAQWEGRSPARPLSKDEAQWHATAQRFRAALQAEMPAMPNIPALATLHFNNNALASQGTAEAFDKLSKRGVIITTLSEAIVHHADLLRAHFMAQPQKLGSEKFAALHAAFVGNGAFIYIPRDVEVPGPIVVMHAARGPNAAVFPHTLVIADDRAKVTVVDLFTSQPFLDPSAPRSAPAFLSRHGRHFACGANDLYAGHGAQITYVAAQDWSREALSFQFNSTVVRRDARVQSLNLHLGARQARHESLSQLQAPGAFSEMLALTVAEGAQEFDQRTLQIHQAPNTKSDLLYKNALLDQARTIFSGLIVVDPDAQKTDAYQSNRNLMLSDDAEANALPGLEIQANDVRCTHGATSSRIDPEQEFYLKSRGITPAAAQELLTFGFFEEVLAKLESEPLHDALHALIKTKFKK